MATDGTVGSCGCGLGYNSTSYCNLFMGDPWGQYLIGNYTRMMKYNTECNSAGKFNYGCFANSNTLYNFK